MKGGQKSSLRPFLHRALQLKITCFGKIHGRVQRIQVMYDVSQCNQF